MKTLVTGADGLLGSNLVRELLGRSHPVRVFLEPGRSFKMLEDLDLEVAYGDLLEIDDVERAVEGCEAIVHCAGLTNIWPAHNPACFRVNVQGTRHVVQAALKHNVKRMVHVSSASVFAHGTLEAPGDERVPMPATQIDIDYIRSKIAGQELVLDAVHRADLPAVIVNPTFMIGAYDSKPSSGAMILAFMNRKLPGYPCGGKNFVYVKDAAIAICNALKQGKTGACYILGNENLTYEAFLNKIALLTGEPPLRLKIKASFIKILGMMGTIRSALTGKAPTVSYPMAKLSTLKQFYSAERARKELGLPYTPVEYAIADAVRWFEKGDYLDFPINLDDMADRLPHMVSLANGTLQA